MIGSILIPGEPDPITQPALRKAWGRMFEPSLEWVEPDLVDLVPHRKKPRLHVTGLPQQPEIQQFLDAASTRYETSKSWAGASIVPDEGKRFVQVYGEWTVPKASIPLGGIEPKYFSATWIGLDGDRRYLDATLPQVGTQQNTPGTDPLLPELPEYYTWFQWWAPRRIRPELWWIRGIPVGYYDEVMGLVWVVDPKIVAVVFCNLTRKKITWFVKDAPIYSHRRHDSSLTYQPNISGATAEWIIEDPTKEIDTTDNPHPLPFADYAKVIFRNCVAGMATAPGAATSEKVLTAPRYKRMYEVLQRPLRTRLISMPEPRTKTTELTVNYGGFRSK